MTILTVRLQKIQQAIMASDPTAVPGSFDLSQADLRMSLRNSGPYLNDTMTAGHCEPEPVIFNRIHERRELQNRHGLPLLSSADSLSLADFENWVESMLENWIRDRQPSEHACNLLAGLLQTYSKHAEQTYAGCPDLMSEMFLTLLELWMAIDRICVSIDSRLKDYSPEIPLDFLQPLLLPHVRQMQRAKRVENYLNCRYQDNIPGLPRIFEDPAPESFAIRYYETCESLRQRRRSIEAQAQRQLQEKQQEVERKSSEHRSLISKAKALRHQWPLDHRGNPYHDPSCQACVLEVQAASMTVEIYEWPLPQTEDLTKTVVFELACPEWFKSWRDVTWRLVHDFGRTCTKQASNMELNLLSYKETQGFAVSWGQRLTLGSQTKSWKRCHYSSCKFPVEFSHVLRPSAFQFRLLDSENNSWLEDQDDPSTLKKWCTYVVPEGPYRHLQYAVDTFRHTENEIIADQRNCHRKLSLHEFIAFGCLRAGERVQWHNMIRELASPALSLNEESVSAIFRQAAWEMGTPAPGTYLREAHLVLQAEVVLDRLLETLEHRLDSIETNWNQHHALHILVILSLRALSISDNIATTDRALQFLRRSRRVAIDWCEELALTLDDQTGEQNEIHQALIIRVGGICQLTYWVEPEKVAAVLHSQDDLYHLTRSSVIVFENSPQDLSGVSTDIKSILVRITKILRSLEQRTRELIEGGASGLVRAIRKSAPNLEFDAAWNFCPDNAARWATNKSATAPVGRQQTVHYNLLSGELLIDCTPPGRLPKEYTEDPLFRRVFGLVRILTPPLPHYQPPIV
jgi:hypothetical protein